MSEGYQPNGPATNEVIPPNQGSHVKYYKHPELVGRSAGRKMVLQVLDSLEESVNKYANSYDPCPLCANKTDAGHAEECHTCAYFYPSHFVVRRNAQ